MTDNLTDEQRADQARNWLRENGKWLVAGLVLGIGGLFGWRQMDRIRATDAETAAALFDEMIAAIRVSRTERAAELGAEITRSHDGTPYADQARLALARLRMDAAAPDDAAKILQETMDRASSEEVARIARLRLGRVMIQQERYDDALAVLSVPADSQFAARFHDVRGDAYYGMGTMEEARREYKAALDATDKTLTDTAYLQAKFDEVGGEPETVAAP
ncbi:MAG: tetratricopeptide repeat protein [Gammaproteobacteria bacterium]|nr:tetratricopeptide repeat protein [Gammaproteobacteria bacterium]